MMLLETKTPAAINAWMVLISMSLLGLGIHEDRIYLLCYGCIVYGSFSPFPELFSVTDGGSGGSHLPGYDYSAVD
jgi:hypothetical protein